MPKKKNQGNVKKVIRQAGPVISKKEMNQIVKAAGGNTQKAVNSIASVQQSMKAADKQAPSVASGAANMLIKQATPTTSFGTSKLGQALRGMVGTPAGPRNPQSGAPQYAATPGTGLMKGGTMIRPGGRPAVRPQPTPEVKTRIISDSGGFVPGGTQTGDTQTAAANPYQDAIDAILGELAMTRTEKAEQDQYFQDMLNQTQLQAQQQAQELSNMFNEQIAGMQGMYDMQIQQQNLLAQQEQEAARAFMINQGRMMNPANLQIGASYGTPQLAGTQGFKSPYRSITPAQAATAFTAPTLAATAATTPMTTQIPTVLNV